MSMWTALRTAFEDRRGVAAVELVLWLPFFLVLLAVITDLSLILKYQTRMYDVAAQASRSVSYGKTTAEAENFVYSQFQGDNIAVSVTIDGTGTFVTTAISTTFGEPMLFGADLFRDPDARFDSLEGLNPDRVLGARNSAFIIVSAEGEGEGEGEEEEGDSATDVVLAQ